MSPIQLGLQGSIPLGTRERPKTLELGVGGEVQFWVLSDQALSLINQVDGEEFDEDAFAVIPWLTPQLTIGLGF